MSTHECNYALGIDLGASSAKIAALDAHENLLVCKSAPHKGNPARCLSELLDSLNALPNALHCCGVVATGSNAKLLEEHGLAIARLEDVPAMTEGLDILAQEACSLIEIGGQSAYYVTGLHNGAAPQFAMNEGCASGTGSFFESQMSRLELDIEDYSALVANANSIPRLSGRCAVFAKTDIIHRQQEGTPVEDILLGLCYAMVKSYKAAIVRGLPLKKPLALAGGVVKNIGVIQAVRDVFKLEEHELIVKEELACLQAVGAARHALRAAHNAENMSSCHVSLSSCHAGLSSCHVSLSSCHAEHSDPIAQIRNALSGEAAHEALLYLEALPPINYAPGDGFSLRAHPWAREHNDKTPCILGVDVGSTSTNLVLLDLEGQLLDAQYLRTKGDAKRAIREGLASLSCRLADEITIVAAATTGSGRTMIGEFIGADAVRDEITAQAKAAAAADPLVDTVFEIGGQDSKYISLENGQVVDFQMNKICAAGTGSFIEEQAKRLGIALKDYGALALSSASPVDLGERCTVFVETAINAALAAGCPLKDIAAGLCLSIVRNYLHRVVAQKRIGNRIVLQGGVAYNPGIVAAFQHYFGDAISVSPWFAVSGAVGVALLAREELQAGHIEKTAFRGLDLAGKTKHTAICDEAGIAANRAFFRKTEALYLEGYNPVRDPEKQTVGVPRCLMLHKLFPMVNAFFSTLGFNVVLSDASNEETVRIAQETAQGETCYPVKLVYGHMEQLAQANVDFVFMPSMHTIRHIKSRVRHNYACPYMQVTPKLVAETLQFEQRGITLLSPLLDMDFGQNALATALLDVGAHLGFSPQESARAMLAGGVAVSEFTRKTEALGEELLGTLAPGERVIVIVTRQYGIADPELNMGIPDALLDRGQKVITVSHLHAHDLDISQDYPGMYWPFGQHMLSGAKLIRRDPRLFAVYLTNHGCGPDTMVNHLFAEEMGDKPYLNIEMDEHYSKVGVITRIEAFLNAIDHWEAHENDAALPLNTKVVNSEFSPLRKDALCVLPACEPYSSLICAWLSRHGFQAKSEPHTRAAMELARKELVSKEYYSFASLLGRSLHAAHTSAQSKDNATVELLIPSSIGSEADGSYDRVIRSILDKQGFSHVELVSPKIERLPWTLHDTHGFFAAMLAGDIVNAAHPLARKALLDALKTQAKAHALDIPALCDAASRAAQSWHDVNSSAADKADANSSAAAKTNPHKCLALLGEWECVFDDALVNGAWTKLEEAGYHIKRMPLSEYLWFLWYDAALEDEKERSSTPFFMDTVSEKSLIALPESIDAHCDTCAENTNVPCALSGKSMASLMEEQKNSEPKTGEKIATLEHLAELMSQVHEYLQDASPFADDVSSLRTCLENTFLAHYIGANGRYRAAKVIDMSQRADGLICAASMYENTDIALKLGQSLFQCACPTVSLNFDGSPNRSTEERLKSFLYYL